MKYVPPYGRENEGDLANYINGDPSVGRQGSIPPAAAFEHPMREIVGVIDKSYYIPSEEDLLQLCKSVRSQRLNYAEDTGSVDNLSVAFDPPFETYTIGLPIRVKVRNTNTGPATIDAGVGVRSIRKPTGAEVNAGDLPAGGMIDLVYDGNVFQLINFGGGGTGGGGGTVENTYIVNIPYTVDTSPTANTIIANFSPPIASLVPGTLCMVKIANTNTSFTNINVNGLGNKPVYAQGGTTAWPLLPSDMAVGDVKIFAYDGSHFWIYANDIVTLNISIPVANTADFNSLFIALGRKRIIMDALVTVQMATGVFDAMITQHPNSDRIVVQGTMLAGNPTSSSFSKTGNSAGARAQDAANNIAMLRSRYGTEVVIGPRVAGIISYGFEHRGPGKITFKDILITGANVSVTDGDGTACAGILANATTITAIGVSVWGSGELGFLAENAASIECTRCFTSNCWHWAYGCGVGASIICDECGAYGSGKAGYYVTMGSTLTLHRFPGAGPNEAVCNNIGVQADSGSSIYAYYAVVNGNSLDAYAYGSSTIVMQGTVFGSSSPSANLVGNNNSIVTVH